MVAAMNTGQRNRHALGLVETMLVGNDVDAAIRWVDQWVAAQGDSASDDVKAQIAEIFLATAGRNAATEQMDVAHRLLAWLRSFVGQSVSLEIQSRSTNWSSVLIRPMRTKNLSPNAHFPLKRP